MRQFSDHYTFRALRNLPEKELRYLRTIIVIADIDEGFAQWARTSDFRYQISDDGFQTSDFRFFLISDIRFPRSDI